MHVQYSNVALFGEILPYKVQVSYNKLFGQTM